MVEWNSGSDSNGNQYFYYPAQESVFKKMITEQGGFYIDIYDASNKKIKRKEVNSKGEEWNSPVITYFRTMTEKGMKYYKLYKNCKLYAVPKNHVDILNSISNDIKQLILDYAEFKKSSKYDEQYKYDFANKNKGIFDSLDNLNDKLLNIENTNFQSFFMRNSGIRWMISMHPEETLSAFQSLFNTNNSLTDRISEFRKIIQDTTFADADWKNKAATMTDPKAETASFYLFAQDYTKYLLFTKITPFNNYAKRFNLTNLLNNADDRYEKWQDYCKSTLIPKMEEVLNTSCTLLDAQDFIWYIGNLDACSLLREELINYYSNKGLVIDDTPNDYTAIKLNSNIAEVHKIGSKSNKFKVVIDYDKLPENMTNNCRRVPDSYQWTLNGECIIDSRDTLSDVIEKIDYILGNSDDDIDDNLNIEDEEMDKMITPLNQILYGPPGTGKTYNTAKEALKILEPDFNSDDRKEIMEKYQFYKNNKQIHFVTFHQAYSYEEFVEGIRPVLSNDCNGLRYELHEGIFKQIVNLAKSEYTKAQVQTDIDLQNRNIFKMSLGNTLDENEINIFDYCLENNCIGLGYGKDIDFSNANSKDEIKAIYDNSENLKDTSTFTIDAVDRFKHQIKNGDLVFISQGNSGIRAIGVVENDYYFNNNSEIHFKQFRNVKWLYSGESIPFDKFSVKKLSQMSIYQLDKQDLKIDFIQNLLGNKENSQIKKYVLIIDEINRGEIAKIFGELITLLEPDKRLLAENEITLTLPNSPDEDFGIPQNLYIIGTMNTADRSIALLDIALRRRFDFIAKYPNANVIGKDGCRTEVEGIDLKLFLNNINEKIELLLDKDHTIGHSYLMGIENYEDFLSKFRNKILPLLQEYFYNDFEKIAQVLRQNIDDDEWTDIDTQIILKKLVDDLPKYSINEKYPKEAFLRICK